MCLYEINQFVYSMLSWIQITDVLCIKSNCLTSSVPITLQFHCILNNRKLMVMGNASEWLFSARPVMIRSNPNTRKISHKRFEYDNETSDHPILRFTCKEIKAYQCCYTEWLKLRLSYTWCKSMKSFVLTSPDKLLQIANFAAQLSHVPSSL